MSRNREEEGLRGSEKELRNLLGAAGYEGAKSVSAEDALREARSYLELLKSRKAHLQVEQRHLMAIVGPSLNMPMLPSHLQRSSNRAAAAAAKLSELKKSQASSMEVHLPDEANLNYKKLFAAMAAPMAIMNSSIVQDSNILYRNLDPMHRPEEPAVKLSERHSLVGGCTLLLNPKPSKLVRTRSNAVSFKRRIEEDDHFDHLQQREGKTHHFFDFNENSDTIWNSSRLETKRIKTEDTSTRTTKKKAKISNEKKPAAAKKVVKSNTKNNEPASQRNGTAPPQESTSTTTRCGRAVRPRRDSAFSL